MKLSLLSKTIKPIILLVCLLILYAMKIFIEQVYSYSTVADWIELLLNLTTNFH